MKQTPPQASTFAPGGEIDTSDDLTCDRCGELATHGYEGVEFLNLCDGCFDDFGRWLNRG